MKKSVLFSALTALCCIACQKTDDRFAPSPVPVYVSEALTVSLADSSVIPQGMPMSAWKLDDKSFSYTSTSEGTQVQFALDPEQTAPDHIAYALYPDVYVDSLHNGVFHLQLTDNQTARLNGSQDCIYAGRVSANTAVLQKACAVLKFTVGCDNAGSCILTSSSSSIAGKAKVSMTESISFEPVAGGGLKSIKLTGDMQKDSVYAVAVFPGTYKLTYAMKATSGMPLGGKEIQGTFTVGLGETINLGTIGADLPPVVPGDRLANAEGYSGYESKVNKWADDSSINVFNLNGNEKYDIKDGSGTNQATFHGNELPAWSAYGLAPYDASAQFGDGEVTTTFPSVQHLVKNLSAQFAIGNTSELTGQMDFKNVQALLRFVITKTNVAKIIVRGNLGETLAGKVKLQWNGGIPKYNVIEAVDSLVLVPSADAAKFSVGTYYAALLPQTLTSGYTVIVISTTGERLGISYVGASTSFARSTVVNAGTVPSTTIGPAERKALAEGYSGDEEISARWYTGSNINVMSATQNEKYTLISGGGGAQAKFNGAEVSAAAVWGVYPYDANANCSADNFTCTLSASQQVSVGVANGFAVATTDAASGNMVFRNVAGLIRFEIKGDNVGEVVIKGNNNETIAGKVNVAWNSGEPTYSVVSGATSISVKAVGGTVMAPGVYYAAVLPQNFSKGITVTVKPYKFATGTVIKHSYQPSSLEKNCSAAFDLTRASVKSVGSVDQGLLWTYTSSKSIMAALRGSDGSHGLYIDLSTGRTFFAIGAYQYCECCDLTMISNLTNGIAPSSVASAASLTNADNLIKFGTYTENDFIGNWPVISNSSFCLVSAGELSDTAFEALKTVDDVKALYDARASQMVHTYYPDNCVTNARRTSSHKYLVIKTEGAEGTGYGIIKFVGLAGGSWYIEMNYKYGIQ